MTANSSYMVVGSRPWSRRVFDEDISQLPGRWHFVARREELTTAALEVLKPDAIFFLHWSWKVPPEIVNNYECVCFHMTDLPFGRGGSPLQNLIARGHRQTRLTAFRMVDEVDSGPVYLKEDLSLEGTAEEIYLRASRLAARMIRRLIQERPAAVTQVGEATEFRQRRPDDSRIPPLGTLEALHDFIRMVDADGYPAAFLEHAGFRYEFSRASLRHDRLLADVTIRPVRSDPS